MDEFDNNQNQQNSVNNNLYQQNDEKTRVFTVKDWLITLLIMMVPCVNIVMMFVWAFGDGNLNRKNYFLAYLIITAIAFAIAIIIYIIIFATVGVSLLNYAM